jgi:hypothetical protein
VQLNPRTGILGSGWPNWANFRPIDDICLFCSLMKITQVAQTFGQFFPKFILCINFDKEWGLRFCAIFSKTYPVTLSGMKFCIVQLFPKFSAEMKVHKTGTLERTLTRRRDLRCCWPPTSETCTRRRCTPASCPTWHQFYKTPFGQNSVLDKFSPSNLGPISTKNDLYEFFWVLLTIVLAFKVF